MGSRDAGGSYRTEERYDPEFRKSNAWGWYGWVIILFTALLMLYIIAMGGAG